MDISYYYSILELDITDNLELVNKKYHQLIKKYHPDVCKDEDAEIKTIEINNAYDEIEKYIKSVNKKNNTYENPVNQEQKNDENYCEDENAECNNIFDIYIMFCDKLKQKYTDFLNYKETIKQEIYISFLIRKTGICEELLQKKYENYKQNNKQPISYVKWLEMKVKEKELIAKLNNDKYTLSKEYNSYKHNLLYKGESPLNWIEWLEERVFENDAINELNKSRSILMKEYYTYAVYVKYHNQKPIEWIDWLKNKLEEHRKINNFLEELNITYERAFNLYQEYIKIAKNNCYGAFTFIDWLESETNYKKYAYKKV